MNLFVNGVITFIGNNINVDLAQSLLDIYSGKVDRSSVPQITIPKSFPRTNTKSTVALTDDMKKAITIVRYAGMTTYETALVLGVSISSVARFQTAYVDYI